MATTAALAGPPAHGEMGHRDRVPTTEAQREPVEGEAEKEDAEEACNQRKFFVERDQVVALLRELSSAEFAVPACDVDDAFKLKHKTVVTILDRYMEQPHLLDPFLRELLAPVLTEIQRIVAGVARERQEALLESDGVAFPFQIYRNPKLHALFQLVYQLCKVRGYKTIVKLLPHEVSDFEPTLLMLQSQDRSDHSVWETRYVLLLWLSMLCLVPFDLNTIDSSATSSLVSNILTLCKSYLADAGATQLAASVCLARLLSRPDMEAHHLEKFLGWADSELRTAAESVLDQSNAWRLPQQFKITGIMRCLAYLAKHSPRDKHIKASQMYFSSVMQLVSALTDDDRSPQTSSTLHRKLSVKLVQRLGLLYLPPRVQPWRYQRGLRSLEMNMKQAGQLSSGVVANYPQPSAHEVDNEAVAFDTVEELEQVVDVLLCGLRDKDTVVRWSAAKGVGRITGRLPFEYADDVVQSVLELFVATEDEGAWHGASLALAELARRGVLLPQRLTEAVDCVARALQYDIRRGAHSIGAHVRDAACYACWSFARAYEPLLLLPHLEKTLAPAMLINCVFDRELNCRRAASAAFQENVGRQGRNNFPNGIDLLTKADYFSVANLRHAFLDVSVFIAKYPEYRYSLLEHLISKKIVHWDPSIRVLAAQATGKIAALDPPYAMSYVLPRLLNQALSADIEVIARHGATLALSQVLRSLVLTPSQIDGELQAKIKLLPSEIEKRRLFRGRGGETIRSAVCELVQIISLAGFSLSFSSVKVYLSVLEECLIHPVGSVRVAAIDAYTSFTQQYCPRLFEKGTPAVRKYLDDLVPRFIKNGILAKTTDKGNGVTLNPNVAARRGYTRAVGVSSKELLQPSLADAFRTLIVVASISQQTAEEQDAESRVAAIQALVDICSRLRVDGLVLPPEDKLLEEQVVSTLVQCIHDDYGVDERGDVGSWVRKEAMLGLQRLLLDVPFVSEALQLKYSGVSVRTPYGVGVIQHALGDYGSDDRTQMTDVLCRVAFEKPALGYFYFPPHGVGLIPFGRLELIGTVGSESAQFVIPAYQDRLSPPVYIHSSGRSFGRRLPATMTASVVCALAKQLAEKLDSIRVVAGTVLFSLVHSQQPRVDGIPDRFQLEKQILPITLTINWSMAHDTFPLVVRLMDIPDYMESVASGLIVSVGGLTESVVKASKSALFDWIRAHVVTKDYGLLSRFSFFLIALFKRHAQDDRVTVPLMKTLSMLLEDGMLAFLFQKRDEDSQVTEFGDRLYAALKDEIARTSAIPKLAAAINVLVGLMPSEERTEAKALKALVLFLAHRFPKVRKHTAERLYTRLLVHEEVIQEDKYDSITDILSGTAWDGPLNDAKRARNEILEHLGMEVPQKKIRADDETKMQSANTASAESYQSLVKEVGY